MYGRNRSDGRGVSGEEICRTREVGVDRKLVIIAGVGWGWKG